jgi:hypothetical protein
VIAVARPLEAVSFTLGPAERDQAISVGQRSVVSDEFGGDWRVKGDAPGQFLTVMTPFHRLALAARNAAFRNQDLRPREVESLARDQENRLVTWVTLRGGRADFARFYTAALLRGQQELKPAFVQNERTAYRDEDGRYTAQCLYVFPAEELDANGTVTVVVRDIDQTPVARFTVDLSTMR